MMWPGAANQCWGVYVGFLLNEEGCEGSRIGCAGGGGKATENPALQETGKAASPTLRSGQSRHEASRACRVQGRETRVLRFRVREPQH